MKSVHKKDLIHVTNRKSYNLNFLNLSSFQIKCFKSQMSWISETPNWTSKGNVGEFHEL